MSKIFFLMLLPFLLFGRANDDIFTIFAKSLTEKNVEECHQVLDEWQSYEPTMGPTILALRASVLLLEGNIILSAKMMDEALSTLERTTLPIEAAEMIRNLYRQTLNFMSFDEMSASPCGLFGAPILLCKVEQPTGVKLQYWFGVAQILTACVVAPFNPPVAGALALSGITTTIQASAQALDNKNEWERNLNERQRANP